MTGRQSLNPEKIKEIEELDESGETLKELIGLFLPSFESKYQRLLDSLASDDRQSIKSISHELRSSCGNLGGEILFDLFRELEYLDQPGKLYHEKAQLLLEKIGKEFSVVKAELKKKA